MPNRPLKEGNFGSILVQYFEDEGKEPPTEALFMEAVSETEINYRLSFADGSVVDYKVTFQGPHTLKIDYIEEFDSVI